MHTIIGTMAILSRRLVLEVMEPRTAKDPAIYTFVAAARRVISRL